MKIKDLKVTFRLNGITYYDARISAPCTEADFKNGKFSEKYVTNTVMSAISSYMDMQQLEGRPELIGFEFVEPQY